MQILKVIGLILVVIMSFNVIIFVHELGHFLAARWRGLVVDRFQIWFGKPIWKKTINGVQYGLGWIPAGGFVALPQMAPMESIEGENGERVAPLPPIKPIDKIIVAFAGPLFSFGLAAVAAVAVWGLGKPVNPMETQRIGYVLPDGPAAEAGLMAGDEILEVNGKPVKNFMGSMDAVMESVIFSKGDKIVLKVDRPDVGVMEIETGFKVEKGSFFKRDGVRQIGVAPSSELIVDRVMEGSPAEVSGFEVGDEVLAVNGVRVYGGLAFSKLFEEYAGKVVPVLVKRGDGEVTLNAASVVPDNGYRLVAGEEPMAMLGIGWKQRATKLVTVSPGKQLADSGKMLFVTIDGLISKDSSINVGHLSGPVGIGKMQYQILQSEYPWRQLLYFWVLFNVNLAIFNMLPFPVLDGGHIVMATGEWIRKKPLNTKVLEYVQGAFVLLLLGMFVFVTIKDVANRIGPEDGAKRGADEPTLPEWDVEQLKALGLGKVN